MKRSQKWLVAAALSAGIVALLVGPSSPAAEGAENNPKGLVQTIDAPIDAVYAAVVQVASADDYLLSAIKDAYTVNFYTGGVHSFDVTVICHSRGNNRTVVTLSIAESSGSPQIFFVGRSEQKAARQFWSELASQLNADKNLGSQSVSPSSTASAAGQLATVSVKSVPDGADITVDGKYVGSTPSTVRLPAGNHKLTVTKEGFQNWQRSLSLGPGATVTVNATLDAEAGHHG
jgi:PEGA domain